jgi:hypothetical protein
LIFDLFKVDIEGWKDLVRMILDCKTSRNRHSFFSLIDPVSARHWLKRRTYDLVFQFSGANELVEQERKRGEGKRAKRNFGSDDEEEECPMFKKAKNLMAEKRMLREARTRNVSSSGVMYGEAGSSSPSFSSSQAIVGSWSEQENIVP